MGASEHEVRIWFDADVAPYLRERPWHPSQSITEHPDGSIEVSLRLNHLHDVERRVLACGAHAEVLAPAELRERLRVVSAAMAARYETASSSATGGRAPEKNPENISEGQSVSR